MPYKSVDDLPKRYQVQVKEKFEPAVAQTLRGRKQPVTEIAFLDKLLSKNQRDKLHWSKRQKWRKQYAKFIAIRYPAPGLPPEYKQRVTITRYLKRGEREWDTANGYAGTSIELVDALVETGYLRDDSPKWCEVVFVQDDTQRHSGYCFKVRIEPA